MLGEAQLWNISKALSASAWWATSYCIIYLTYDLALPLPFFFGLEALFFVLFALAILIIVVAILTRLVARNRTPLNRAPTSNSGSK